MPRRSNHCIAAACDSRRRVAAAPESERDVVDDGQVIEQEPVLEHDTDRSLSRRHETPGRRVVENLAVELDPTAVDRLKAGEGPDQGRLSGAVRPDEHDQLSGHDRELHIEVEPAEPHSDAGVETGSAHGASGAGARPRPSTRLPTTDRTTSETASSTRLNTMPAGWLFSNAR